MTTLNLLAMYGEFLPLLCSLPTNRGIWATDLAEEWDHIEITAISSEQNAW